MEDKMARKKLGEILIDAGVLDDMQLRSALSEQKKWGKRLGSTLVQLGFVEEGALTKALSSQMSLPSVNPMELNIPDSVLKTIPIEKVEKYQIIPFAVEKSDIGKGTLKLAMADPTNLTALDEIQFSTGYKTKVYVSPISVIEKAISKFYGHKPAVIITAPQAAVAVAAPPETSSAQRNALDPKNADEMIARLSGEFKTLVKLLVKKGIILQEEYYNELGKLGKK